MGLSTIMSAPFPHFSTIQKRDCLHPNATDIHFDKCDTLFVFIFILKGGEISEPGSVDELSTGHFNMPYDMVREGTAYVISVNFLV